MLTGVTITGADDFVAPAELMKLSAEFPFVEWGILFSSKRSGWQRYPSGDWLWHLARTVGRRRAKFSAHFCGEVARDALAGDPRGIEALPRIFQRVQLNGWVPAPSMSSSHPLSDLIAKHPDIEFILQVRDFDSIPSAYDEALLCGTWGGRGSLLFDPSGGRGIAAAQWPRSPAAVRMGFAGGINPSNVVSVLKELNGEPAGCNVCSTGDRPPFWIDMESGVRSGTDRLDLGLVRAVLTAAAPFIDDNDDLDLEAAERERLDNNGKPFIGKHVRFMPASERARTWANSFAPDGVVTLLEWKSERMTVHGTTDATVEHFERGEAYWQQLPDVPPLEPGGSTFSPRGSKIPIW